MCLSDASALNAACRTGKIGGPYLCKWNKAYEYSSSLIHTLCHLEPHKIAFRQRRDKREGKWRERNERMGPRKPQEGRGIQCLPWTEPHEKGGKPHCLVTDIHGDTSRQATPFGLQFPRWGQLQGQHWYPTAARTMSCGMLPRWCPWLGPVLGLHTGTKQMVEMSHSAIEDLEEIYPWLLLSQFLRQTNTVI